MFGFLNLQQNTDETVNLSRSYYIFEMLLCPQYNVLTLEDQRTEKYNHSWRWQSIFGAMVVQEGGVNETKKLCILRKDGGRKTYKFQITKELKQ